MTRLDRRSDSQANAEALNRRERTYSAASEASFRISWDWTRREPRDLREAVRMARAAYNDETPVKLHDAQIGEGGTPRMTAAMERILDSPNATDAPKGERPLVSHYLTPFRAALDRLDKGAATEQRRARMVRHVTVGGMSPSEAAIREKANPFDAKLVIEDALRSFLRTLSDLRVDANHIEQEPLSA